MSMTCANVSLYLFTGMVQCIATHFLQKDDCMFCFMLVKATNIAFTKKTPNKENYCLE